MTEHAARIRAGMGGWTFEPWDESFYPEKLAKKRQLEFASRAVPAIEVNGTYYGSQKPETFAKWASETPDDFIFTLKGNRFVTNRRILAEAGESMERFLSSGISELGAKLGPILWQFMPTKKFDQEDFEAFLKLLPSKQDGIVLRHALEVRNESFCTPQFPALARKYGCAIVYAHHAEYPEIADVTGDFVYARLQRGSDDNPDCYPDSDLDAWAKRTQIWADGGTPDDLPYIGQVGDAEKKPRDVFVFFITEGKVRAPFGAQALMRRLRGE
ncbi:DUF72 domain-containing protein [Limoniibacter endophyticus]|uniref:DUF72 domain-containing protein n=1 Tax=Limoniibacter endophyticus TaxID=1565040 RepID=A0A8J3DFG5_9HYPH|nr:DUF72 domain-containing protein [Limoniibacter endophyticus]GHC61143.1 hypothetical protein GCM10010136_01550 [Limoniibacter endophyticus]